MSILTCSVLRIKHSVTGVRVSFPWEKCFYLPLNYLHLIYTCLSHSILFKWSFSVLPSEQRGQSALFFLDMAFVGRYSVKIAESIYFLSSHLGSVGLKKRQGLGLKKEKLHVGSHWWIKVQRFLSLNGLKFWSSWRRTHKHYKNHERGRF